MTTDQELALGKLLLDGAASLVKAYLASQSDKVAAGLTLHDIVSAATTDADIIEQQEKATDAVADNALDAKFKDTTTP